jgi:hypothetical protein
MNSVRLATWLMQRWDSGHQRESLVRDLIERYQQGRSPVWYWRQVLRAIIVGMLYEMGGGWSSRCWSGSRPRRTP